MPLPPPSEAIDHKEPKEVVDVPPIESEALVYSPELTVTQKLGSQFFFYLDGVYKAHLTLPPTIRDRIVDLALILQTVYTHTYLSYKQVPQGRGGHVKPGGFLYKSNYLGSSSSPMDLLLLEVLPEELKFNSTKAVALLRIMGPGCMVTPHIDDPCFGPAIIFCTLQQACSNDSTVGALSFSDGFSTTHLPSDPSKMFCFFGAMRHTWKHCVESLPSDCEPRITVTYRLWGNEVEPWYSA